MKAYVSFALRAVRALSVLTTLAVLPMAGSLMAYPINKDSVYVGPITVWMAVSMALWFALGVACVMVATWVHFRHPPERRQAWYATLAGQCAFWLLLAGCGAVIHHSLEGRWSGDWSDLIFVAIGGVLWFSLRQLRA
ncbi:MAG: hypothetical protein J7549_18115 [Variovorax sp.]|nr:hypothetical protein [Variovorax sp.]